MAGFNRTNGVLLGMSPNEIRSVFVEDTSLPRTYDFINLMEHSKVICEKNKGLTSFLL